MASESVFKKFTKIIVILIIAIVATVLFFIWQVGAEEPSPEVSKTELIESNKVWVNNQMQIPLQENIILSIPAANTDATIATNGDLIIATSNKEILEQLATSSNRYKGIKAYRLRIEAKKVSEYVTNTKYRFPTSSIQNNLTNYEITGGERTVKTEKNPVKVKASSGNNIILDLKTTYSSDDAEIATDIFTNNIPEKLTITDNTKQLTTMKNVAIYPKSFVYDFTLQKSTMLIFKERKEEMITEPIGIEYIIK